MEISAEAKAVIFVFALSPSRATWRRSAMPRDSPRFLAGARATGPGIFLAALITCIRELLALPKNVGGASRRRVPERLRGGGEIGAVVD